MEGETLKTRLLSLLQKSRKAVRLYSSYDRMSSERASSSGRGSAYPGSIIGSSIIGASAGLLEEFDLESESADLKRLHWEQWQSVNAELQRELRVMLDRPTTRTLASDTVSLRDRFYGMWRTAEAQLRIRQTALIEAGTRGDFLKAAALARTTVSLRAYEQATAAVQHEVQLVVDRFRLADSFAGIPSSSEGESELDNELPNAASSNDTSDSELDVNRALRFSDVVSSNVPAYGSAPTRASEVSELAKKLAITPNDIPSKRSEEGSTDSLQSSRQPSRVGLAKVIPLRRSIG